ncbi:hypothetical protein ACBI01_000156 [Aeromonas veronii]
MTRHFIIGDHLVTPQPEGHHHGLFVGHDQVIHCLSTPAGEPSGQLALTSLTAFSQHGVIEVKPHAQRLFSREETLTRAYARLNEGEQGQPFASGEQFVTWCIEGLARPPKLLQTVVAAEVARHTLGKAATSATAGLTASTLATTAGSSGAAATVVSVTGIAAAPLLAPLAVGVVAAYGVSKLWDWLND